MPRPYFRLSTYVSLVQPVKKKKAEEKAKVVADVWGTEFMQIYAALQIYHYFDLKKRMNRIKESFGKDSLKKWMIIYFTPYQTASLPIVCSPKAFVQIILPAKWLVWPSRTSPQTAPTTFAFSSVCILLLWFVATTLCRSDVIHSFGILLVGNGFCFSLGRRFIDEVFVLFDPLGLAGGNIADHQVLAE